MLVRLLILFAAVIYSTNGHPFELSKQHPNAKYFNNNRIIGGVEAPPGYGKHMVALLYGYRWVSFICGGSIITRRHILTAAHCIDVMLTWNQQLVESFRGVIGTQTWASGKNEVEFSTYVMHSGWNWDTIKNDIGLLTVTRDIRNSDTVSIIPLNFDWMDGGLDVFVTGWGLHADMFDLPETLQLLNLRTVTHEQCKNAMSAVNETLGPLPDINRNVEICALHSVGHGMCNGDSGSALILRRTNQQIGIVSWGIACAQGIPDVYARVSGFRTWVESNTQGYL